MSVRAASSVDLAVLQSEPDARRRVELLGRDHQRVERLGEAWAIAVGIEDEAAPLFDQRLGERVDEMPLRQRQGDGRALSGLAGDVGRMPRS